MNYHLRNTCKIGQAEKCCRYLTVGAEGFECAKLTSLKPTIDARVEAGTFTAKGDNCLGVNDDKSKRILNEKLKK